MTTACRSRALTALGRLRCPVQRRSSESGSAYLLALLAVVVLLISSQTLLENLATQGRRMREQEAIWRGEQVERAIRLYYHKTGHYPQNFDDLQSGLPDLHFLREEAIKNPMNKTDGTWRFIYVNAAGQIIGSVKYATLQQMAILDLNHGKIPPVMPGAVSASSLASSLGQSAQNGSQSGTTGLGQPAVMPGAVSASSLASSLGQSAQNGSQSGTIGLGQPENPLAALKPTGPVDGPVPGALLTGVAGKTDTKSLIVYKGGKKYLDWEFIWNPIEDQARTLQQQGGGTSNGLLPGMSNPPGVPNGPTGTGTSPGGNIGPGGMPPATSPNAPGEPSNPSGAPPDENSPPQDEPQPNPN